MKLEKLHKILRKCNKKYAEEDEITTAILSSGVSDTLTNGDTYAPSDNRIPTALGGIQRRTNKKPKKKKK